MSPHIVYVAASYAVAFLTVAVLIVWVLADGRARQRELDVLNASGIRRRSERLGGDSA